MTMWQAYVLCIRELWSSYAPLPLNEMFNMYKINPKNNIEWRWRADRSSDTKHRLKIWYSICKEYFKTLICINSPSIYEVIDTPLIGQNVAIQTVVE